MKVIEFSLGNRDYQIQGGRVCSRPSWDPSGYFFYQCDVGDIEDPYWILLYCEKMGKKVEEIQHPVDLY